MGKRKNKGGRPKKITKDVLQKLDDAFSNACTDDEACLYAGIAPATLYNYQLKHPEYVERKEALKLTPNLGARKTIAKSIANGDNQTAKWWIEKKDPSFAPTQNIKHTGAVAVVNLIEDMTPDEKIALEALRIARRKRIESESRALPG